MIKGSVKDNNLKISKKINKFPNMIYTKKITTRHTVVQVLKNKDKQSFKQLAEQHLMKHHCQFSLTPFQKQWRTEDSRIICFINVKEKQLPVQDSISGKKYFKNERGKMHLVKERHFQTNKN